VIASLPVDEVAVPAVVTTLAGADATRAVWRNELGGLTFELTAS
jgi:kanamycin kinase